MGKEEKGDSRLDARMKIPYGKFRGDSRKYSVVGRKLTSPNFPGRFRVIAGSGGETCKALTTRFGRPPPYVDRWPRVIR